MVSTINAMERAAAREALEPATAQQSSRTLLRSLRTLAARYADQQEVVAVCRKWARRVTELERQAGAGC